MPKSVLVKFHVWWPDLGVIHLILEKVAAAPAALAPLDVVATALGAAEPVFPEHCLHARQHQHVVAANAELRERELMKLASLSAALRGRGVEDPAAGLTANVGIAVFKSAFERWLDETNHQNFRQLVQGALGELRAVTAGH